MKHKNRLSANDLVKKTYDFYKSVRRDNPLKVKLGYLTQQSIADDIGVSCVYINRLFGMLSRNETLPEIRKNNLKAFAQFVEKIESNGGLK